MASLIVPYHILSGSSEKVLISTIIPLLNGVLFEVENFCGFCS